MIFQMLMKVHIKIKKLTREATQSEIISYFRQMNTNLSPSRVYREEDLLRSSIQRFDEFNADAILRELDLIVDNYSRKILSHLVSNRLNAQNRLKTIKEAYENEFGMIYSDLRLIVDGGSENNNHIVDRYVEMLPNLQKLVAP